MPANFKNFPFAVVVDGILSYLQWTFSNSEKVPTDYLWDPEDRKSKIRIGAPFVIDNEKPMSAPFIVVERGGLSFANRVLDNLKSAQPNTFERKDYVEWTDGTISITCGSRSAAEASGLANFIAINLNADKYGIKQTIRCIRNIYSVAVSPEVPVVKDTEVRRWEVTLTVAISLQFGWFKILREPEPFNQINMYQEEQQMFSDKGITQQGSDLLVDTTKNFGFLDTNDPQFIQQELDRGYYYIRFRDNSNNQLYTIVEVVDNNTIRLQTHDTNHDPVPWSAEESAVDVEYDLLWNTLHIAVRIPNETTP